VRPESPDFVKNRVAMQAAYMKEIEEKFPGMVRAVLPLFETEVRGVPMLAFPGLAALATRSSFSGGA
jgi:hypothetical protein